MLSLYVHICSDPLSSTFLTSISSFLRSCQRRAEQFWALPKGNEYSWLGVPASGAQWGSSVFCYFPGQENHPSVLQDATQRCCVSFLHSGLLGSRPPTAGRVTNLPSVFDPSPAKNPSLFPLKEYDFKNVWPHQTCLCRNFGKPNFIPKSSEPQAFPSPLRTTNYWKADVSFSLFNKYSEESRGKDTFRLWGRLMPKHLD